MTQQTKQVQLANATSKYYDLVHTTHEIDINEATRALAEFLHLCFCKDNHANGCCNWYYGQWSDTVIEPAHKHYYEQALKLHHMYSNRSLVSFVLVLTSFYSQEL